MTDRGHVYARRMIDRWRPGGPMPEPTIIQAALEDIDRQMREEFARIDQAKVRLVYLQQEKDQILQEAAAAARVRDAADVKK